LLRGKNSKGFSPVSNGKPGRKRGIEESDFITI